VRTAFVAILLLGISFVLYANTLDGELIWDDQYLITHNQYLESWRFLPKLFQNSLHVFAPRPSNYYRPLQSFTYLVDRTIWGGRIWGYHFTNIVLHGLVGVLVYGMTVCLGLRKKVAFGVALLFTVHPLHTEAVSYISGRADSLSAFFMLGALLVFHQYLQKRHFGFYLLALFAFICALLSKEIAIALPFLLFLFLKYHHKEREAPELLVPFFLILLLYAGLRWTLLDFRIASSKDTESLFHYALATFHSFLLYMKWCFIPFPLHMGRFIPEGFLLFHPAYGLGALFLLGWGALSSRLSNQKLMMFSWGWFLILVLPSAPLFLKSDRIAEHFLYLALWGWLLGIGQFGMDWMDRSKEGVRRVLWVMGAFWIVGLACLTVYQNQVWKNPKTFYAHILKYAPNNWTALNNLGNLLEREGAWEEADRYLRKAIAIDPERPESHSNLGILLMRQGDLEHAMQAYQTALRLSPENPALHNNLAALYRLKGEWQKAILAYQRALSLNPQLVESRYFLAKTYEQVGETTLAEKHYRYLKGRGIRVEMR